MIIDKSENATGPEVEGGKIGPIKPLWTISRRWNNQWNAEADGVWRNFSITHASHGWKSPLYKDIFQCCWRCLMTASGWVCPKQRCHTVAMSVWEMEVVKVKWDCFKFHSLSEQQLCVIWITTLLFESRMWPWFLWNMAEYPELHHLPMEMRFPIRQSE